MLHCSCLRLPVTGMGLYERPVSCEQLQLIGCMQVAYIDTEGTFRAEKIRAIATRFDLDADAVLDNVMPLQPYNHVNGDCMMDHGCIIKRRPTVISL